MNYIHADSNSGDDGNDGSTWALAKLTLTGALAIAVAGDFIFLRNDAGAGFIETQASTKTYTLPASTEDNPVKIYAVKTGTTNEGANIVNADLVTDIDHSDTALLAATGSASSLTWGSGGSFLYGTTIECGNDMSMSAVNYNVIFKQCRFIWANPGIDFLRIGQTGGGPVDSLYRFYSCDFAPVTNGELRIGRWGLVEFFGGSLAGDWNTIVIASGDGGVVHWLGFDFSAVTIGTLVGGNIGSNFLFDRCKLPASMTRVASSPKAGSRVEFIASDSASDHTIPIPDYVLEAHEGTVESETTVVRTGGASDGDNSLTYKMTALANMTRRGILPLYSPWFPIWVTGSDTDVAVYIMRQAAADTLDDSEIWLEVAKPNEGVGSAGSDYEFDDGQRNILPDDAANHSTETTSVWAGGGDQTKWKLNRSIAPEYAGPLLVRVAYAPETTDVLFVDGKPDVT